MRSRAVSLPRSCWRSTAASEPAWSASSCSFASWLEPLLDRMRARAPPRRPGLRPGLRLPRPPCAAGYSRAPQAPRARPLPRRRVTASRPRWGAAGAGGAEAAGRARHPAGTPGARPPARPRRPRWPRPTRRTRAPMCTVSSWRSRNAARVPATAKPTTARTTAPTASTSALSRPLRRAARRPAGLPGTPLVDEDRAHRRRPEHGDEERADRVARPVPGRGDGRDAHRRRVGGADQRRGVPPAGRDDQHQRQGQRRRDRGVPARVAGDRQTRRVAEQRASQQPLQRLGGQDRPADEDRGGRGEPDPGPGERDEDDRAADDRERRHVDAVQQPPGGLLDPRVQRPAEEGVVVEVLAGRGPHRQEVQDGQRHQASDAEREEHPAAAAPQRLGSVVDRTSLAEGDARDGAGATPGRAR